MAVALGGACVNGGKFSCGEFLASTNTMFFRIFIGPIGPGLCVPWADHTLRQLLPMQHSVLLLIECMRLLPGPGLSRVTLLVFHCQ